ncbi:PREDICTED: ubiquitin carboxyl-terminal hydrolase 2 [Thamnophis sirtalis]|uniref:Ubiquitin carboxyl-terminal hydrolase 2 n=1 Tax=Thamnophis sirtalis TaxID=35019 RepID=A0A6I9XAA1_9SAUR|nr:PREDICTED: ubiquitin carboxyl-terminal hydrolase 2 [Thamnophis sirtalis]
MSQLSSTLKRYVDSPRYSDTLPCSKASTSYATYSSYSSKLSSSYSDKEKLSYKPGTPSSYLTSTHLRTSGATASSSLNFDGGGRLLQRPDSGTRLSPGYSRVPVRPSGGLSGGATYSFANGPSTSYGSTPLGRKKSSSHSDLARELSSMHLSSDPYPSTSTRSPFAARPRQELCSIQGFYQPSRHSDYVQDYLESYSRKGGRSPGLHSSTPEVITSSFRPTSHSSVQQWEWNDSQTDIPSKENPCFMNSILQCLSNTKELRDYCLQSQYVRDLNNNSRMQMSLMTEFAKLIQALWTSSPNESVSPSEFKMQIQRYAPRFVGYNQQDAQEFLRFLLDGLHSEVNRVLVRPKGNNDNLDHLAHQILCSRSRMTRSISSSVQAGGKSVCYVHRKPAWPQTSCSPSSLPLDLFVGQLKSSLTCSSCGYCSTAFDPFWDLSLPIAKVTFHALGLPLDKQTSFACGNHLALPPFSLIPRPDLKRFSEARMRSSKLTTFVNFPLKDLDLREFASQNCNHAIYNLYAISNHSGTTMGGHYTAYCKSPVSGEWNAFNDSRVTPISLGHLRSSDAYLLFYELASPSSRM